MTILNIADMQILEIGSSIYMIGCANAPLYNLLL